MNRWTRILCTALLAATSLAATAQTLVREAPRDVVPGRLTITQPPEATLNGQAARLSPGVRIRDTRNMLVLSGSLAGKETPVVYRRDSVGLVHEVWLLTEAEYDKLGGNTPVTGDPVAVRQFQEAMALIFGTRR